MIIKSLVHWSHCHSLANTDGGASSLLYHTGLSHWTNHSMSGNNLIMKAIQQNCCTAEGGVASETGV